MSGALIHFPGPDLFRRQIAAAVDDSHDKDFPWEGQIDDPVTLKDQLPYILAAFGLGDGTANLWKLFQLLDGYDDLLNKCS